MFTFFMCQYKHRNSPEILPNRAAFITERLSIEDHNSDNLTLHYWTEGTSSCQQHIFHTANFKSHQ